ncbi:MAG: CDP-diacylglycerol--serine O-phosphatidyltransferase [Verrucomicrobiae bacterium]|nr:CDP-diacylglycerol--serine O-phosphatidyltransferase [Verrucomicrobiae bacterium]
MNQTSGKPNNQQVAEPKLKIYFLPNLMTAGNLFCGFVALTKIVEANPASPLFNHNIKTALFYILLACIFDILDGRVARWGGKDSPFGREFDSLADLISFGVAPAFLVHKIVLKDVFPDFPEVGWFIASIYLICGALRLARFNCLSAMGASAPKDFIGFPIPAAAGLVASLTLFLMWWEDKGFEKSDWRYVLFPLLLFLSIMMVSEVRYPSFKAIDLRAQKGFAKMVMAILFIGALLILRNKILPIVLPLLLITYLLYGLIRTRISESTIKKIEEEEIEEEE